MIQYFTLKGALYIEITTGSFDSKLRPSIIHYASRASIVGFVCTGARLLFVSGVLLFSRQKHSIALKEIITSRAPGLFKLAILKYVLKSRLINKVHE